MSTLRDDGRVLLVSCYELGQQPLTVARAAAYLARAGFHPAAIDLARQRWEEEQVRRARLIAVAVPMHAALRIGTRFAVHARAANPQAHLCFFGLYASLLAEHLLRGTADSVIGGEPEETLRSIAEALDLGRSLGEVRGLTLPRRTRAVLVGRIDLPPLRRDELPPLSDYVRLEAGDARHVAAAVESSRGCRHRCRHCPIPPVYAGRFFAVPVEIVLADVRDAVARGARHVTFADPDFLNGPTHALRIVRRLRTEYPGLTFDFTAKVEHLLRDRSHLPEFAASGCAFAVTAVESLSDPVLAILDKGHTRKDVFELIRVARNAGLALRPTLLPFTPWATRHDYRELLDWIDGEGLRDAIDPVQLAIRLLVPPGSLLEGHPDFTPHVVGPDPANFCVSWKHPDAVMDALAAEVGAVARAGALADEAADLVHERIRQAAALAFGLEPCRRERVVPAALDRVRPPRLTEPWFC